MRAMYSGLLANQRASRSTSGLSSGGMEKPARIRLQMSAWLVGHAPSAKVAMGLLFSALGVTATWVGAGETLATGATAASSAGSVAIWSVPWGFVARPGATTSRAAGER